MHQRTRVALLLLACCLATPPARGQETKAPAKPPDFSGEAYVVEQSIARWSFENDGTNTRQLTVRLRVQSDAGVQQFGLLRFPYQKATEEVDIAYVRVRKPDGSVVPTPVEDAQDMPAELTQVAPFYSDLREKQLPVKALSSGDVLEFQAHYRETKPLAPGQFWMEFQFSRDEIVLEQKVEISVPRERAVKVKSPELAPVVTEEAGRRVYTWTRANLEHKQASKAELAQLAVRGRLPAPDILVSSFQSWEEVGRWYDGLQRDRVAPTPEVRAKAAELTRTAPDDAAKLLAIYKYVSTQFRYIGVDFGIGRYQPHTAAEVMSNEYGDCKDKHTLLAALLAAANIPAYPALLNSARLLDPDVPSPGQFDHVITVVPRGKDWVWLDTTVEVAPLGYLPTALRDKQALVVTPDRPASLEMTPPDPPFPASWTYHIDATLDDSGTLTGKVEQTFRGDTEVQFRLALRRLPRTQWKELVQRISYVTGFTGEVSDVDASLPEATEAPLRISYTYKRTDYSDWKGRRIAVLAPEFLSLPDEENGKLPATVWLGAPGTVEFESRIRLPKGYTAQLPKNQDLVEVFAEYHSSYSLEGTTLVARGRLVLREREIGGRAVAAYKAFGEKVGEDRHQYILLSSGSSRTAGEALAKLQSQIWALPDSDEPKAMEAERAARGALARGALREATRSLEQAVAADPEFTRDWILLAQVYMGTMQKNAGLAAYHKAIDSDPDEPLSYKLLAFALMSLERRDEAIEVWLQMARVEPDDHDIPTNLGNLLLAEKRYKEALPYLEAAAKLYPEQSGLQVNLGMGYLGAGDAEKALAAFAKAIAMEPGEKNNVAYILADANQHPELALRYAQDAVRDVEAASRKVRLDSLTVSDLGQVSTLAADWDTLGWVYYRLGDLKQAESYLAAAWALGQDPVEGEHLGRVYEQQHRRQEAIHMYRLVLAYPSTRAQTSQAFTDARAHLQGLGVAAGAGQNDFASVGELSKLRTIPLPRLLSGQASAELFVLLGPGPTVEDIRFISGSEQLRSADKALLQARFPNTFPKDSTARVVRRGILGCYPVTGCSFVLLPPAAVNSVE